MKMKTIIHGFLTIMMGLTVLFAESSVYPNFQIEDDLPPGVHCFFIGDEGKIIFIGGSIISTLAVAATVFKLPDLHYFSSAEDKNKVPLFIDQTEITGGNKALVQTLRKRISVRLIDHSHNDSHSLTDKRPLTKLAEVDAYSEVGVYYTSDEDAEPILIAGPFKINLKPQVVKKVKNHVTVVIPSEDALGEELERKHYLDLNLHLVGTEESQHGEGNGLAYAKLKVEVDKEVEEKNQCKQKEEQIMPIYKRKIKELLRESADSTPAEFTFELENNNNRKVDLYVLVQDENENDIFEKRLLPGQTYNELIVIDNPSTSAYAVTAIGNDEQNYWVVAIADRYGNEHMITNKQVTALDATKSFEGVGKNKFKGIAADFDLTYSADDQTGTFRASLSNKARQKKRKESVEDKPAAFQFTLKNQNTKNIDLYVLIRDKTKNGEEIFEKQLSPGETFDKKVEIDNPANSCYAVLALANDKESYWGIAAVQYDGKENLTIAKSEKVDPNINFEGEGKFKFKGLTADFELTYDADEQTGTFKAILKDKNTAITPTPAEFTFNLENKAKNLDLYIWVADKKGNVIFEKNLLPGERFSDIIVIDDPATSVYSVIASTGDEKNLWRIIKVEHKGSEHMTAGKKVTDTDVSKAFDGQGIKSKFKNVKASFDLKYDETNQAGTFTATLEPKLP